MKPIKEPGMGTVEEYAAVEQFVEQLPYAVGDQDQMQIYDAFKDCYLAGKLAGAPKWISLRARKLTAGECYQILRTDYDNTLVQDNSYLHRGDEPDGNWDTMHRVFYWLDYEIPPTPERKL